MVWLFCSLIAVGREGVFHFLKFILPAFLFDQPKSFSIREEKINVSVRFEYKNAVFDQAALLCFWVQAIRGSVLSPEKACSFWTY
jgi:hypothetical protein